jgi:hypothetical protein
VKSNNIPSFKALERNGFRKKHKDGDMIHMTKKMQRG